MSERPLTKEDILAIKRGEQRCEVEPGTLQVGADFVEGQHVPGSIEHRDPGALVTPEHVEAAKAGSFSNTLDVVSSFDKEREQKAIEEVAHETTKGKRHK